MKQNIEKQNIQKGSYVRFHLIKNGKKVGLGRKIYKIIDCDMENTYACDLLVVDIKNTNNRIYTTRESVDKIEKE